jgi:hypothetical protein
MAEEVDLWQKTLTPSPDEAALGEITGRLGIAMLSLTPLLASSGRPVTELYFCEGHWNAAAHRLAAEFLGAPLGQVLQASGQVKALDSKQP